VQVTTSYFLCWHHQASNVLISDAGIISVTAAATADHCYCCCLLLLLVLLTPLISLLLALLLLLASLQCAA
jgi:hypothetical protein